MISTLARTSVSLWVSTKDYWIATAVYAVLFYDKIVSFKELLGNFTDFLFKWRLLKFCLMFDCSVIKRLLRELVNELVEFFLASLVWTQESLYRFSKFFSFFVISLIWACLVLTGYNDLIWGMRLHICAAGVVDCLPMIRLWLKFGV